MHCFREFQFIYSPAMKPEKTISKLKSGDDAVLVALGDSLTYGWMVGKGYLDFFKEMLRKQYPQSRFSLVNRGVPGDTAEGGLCRIDSDVLDSKPDCVLVQFALNDAFSGCSPEDYRRNIEEIIARVRGGSSAEIVLVTSVYLGEDRYNDMIEERYYGTLEDLAWIRKTSIARVHALWKKKVEEGVDFRSLVQFDLVHPTEEGYRLMAEAVMKVFS
jgi:lysophospholipase L1-like esterase